MKPNVPRTGRRRKLRVKKTFKRKIAGKRNPKQLAAAVGKRKKRRRR